jgi:hypothetical protein
MKNVIKLWNWKMILTLLIFNLVQVVLWAQDEAGGSSTTSTKKVDVSVETTEWYTSPWVWIVGAAVFILLLVALLGGGSRRAANSSSDRVTVTKTVERDTDVGRLIRIAFKYQSHPA